ncbi:MAG TPA: bifunctional YncE family protein/alkaline phosphatase family protein [Bryobacteraceae bacterium]|nr:bifunctional YncE family protein/alkaline phosphatase family protein [Bryobacteraceae bacterium]
MKFSWRSVAALAALLIGLAYSLPSQPHQREQVGPFPSGGFLLNTGWRIQPVGQQVPLDTLPMSAVVSPNGRFMVVLNGGYKPPSLSVVSLEAGREISRTPVADAWLGLTFAPGGRTLWVGGGSSGSVFEFTLSDDGKLSAGRTFDLVAPGQKTWQDFIGDVAVSPDNRMLYAADLYHDRILVVNLQSGRVIERYATGRRPYRVFMPPDGESFFVTSWADGTLLQHQTINGSIMQRLPVGPHPTDIVWSDRKPEGDDTSAAQYRARLFVSAANTNNVYTIGITDSRELRRIDTINVAMTPQQPVGMTPSALALSPNQTRLFVVCSDANAVAVADVSEARAHVLGFIPVGWYPTAAKVLEDNRLIVLNGRGSRSYPNPKGPNPSVRPEPLHEGVVAPEYVGRLQTGTASIVPPLTDETLTNYTQQVFAYSPYSDAKLGKLLAPTGNPIPDLPGGLTPIEHVLYIVKENRTYDQVLGDIGKGESDPSLVLFKNDVSPNHHKLAREFVLLDNFYVNSDVSADGHAWSTSAIANDYIVKLWPNSYAKRRNHYDYEGSDPAAVPPANYIWTNAAAHNITMRNYGYFANNRAKPGEDGVQVDSVRDPVLGRVTNTSYRSFDLDYPDVNRAQTFLRDLAQFESSNQMPKFMIMRLGNDHTSGTAPGKIAPLSSFADNDYALGMIVEGISHSKFWTSTAIFVVEDDAQNGPDHIDSHRSPAFVISPWTHSGAVDSTMYNTTSVLRTIELILGLYPMTQFDAAARPMYNAFASNRNEAPYVVEKPRIPLDARNPANSATAAQSREMDFSEADRADDDELNDVLWRAIRGTEPPPPIHSFFAR